MRAWTVVGLLAACGRSGFDPVPDARTCVPATSVIAIRIGEHFACAQLADRTLRCWGDGSEGQLGTGDYASHEDPIEPLGLGPVEAFALGNAHACALAGGAVRCWGRNHTGQLGLDDVVYRAEPTVVPGLANVAALATGGMNTCAVTQGGELWCWGQVNGSATTTLRVPTRVQVPTSIATAALASTDAVFSTSHGCAVSTDGGAWCFGYNGFGQLGIGVSTTTSDTPVRALLAVPIAEVAAGDLFTCARTTAGDVYCWGYGVDGNLGDGTTTSRSEPRRIEGLTSVAQIAAHRGTACARTTGGELYCWGANSASQVRDNDGTPVLAPARMPLTDVRDVALGFGQICALAGEIVYCSGRERADARGQRHTTPVTVASLANVAELHAIGDRTCARTSDGALSCWGENRDVLGAGGSQDQAAPVEVATNVQAFGLGQAHGCLVSNGAVSCWGSDNVGQVSGTPNPITIVAPTPIASIAEPITAVSLGTGHSCALAPSRNVWCWGENDEGQLGMANGVETSPPAITSFSPATTIATGGNHTCVISFADGSVMCGGRNNEQQIDTMPGDAYTPRQAVPAATALAAQAEGNCAIIGGAAACWGDNMTGQLGNGSHANTATPSMAIAGAAFVATSDRHACELTTFGEAWCWGANDSGQLGDGTLISTTIPVRAPQLDGAVQLALGQRHTCMIDAAGAVRCIGSDWRGQLGDGGALLDPTPSPAPISCP